MLYTTRSLRSKLRTHSSEISAVQISVFPSALRCSVSSTVAILQDPLGSGAFEKKQTASWTVVSFDAGNPHSTSVRDFGWSFHWQWPDPFRIDPKRGFHQIARRDRSINWTMRPVSSDSSVVVTSVARGERRDESQENLQHIRECQEPCEWRKLTCGNGSRRKLRSL